jgi:hypothetical protein
VRSPWLDQVSLQHDRLLWQEPAVRAEGAASLRRMLRRDEIRVSTLGPLSGQGVHPWPEGGEHTRRRRYRRIWDPRSPEPTVHSYLPLPLFLLLPDLSLPRPPDLPPAAIVVLVGLAIALVGGGIVATPRAFGPGRPRG